MARTRNSKSPPRGPNSLRPLTAEREAALNPAPPLPNKPPRHAIPYEMGKNWEASRGNLTNITLDIVAQPGVDI